MRTDETNTPEAGPGRSGTPLARLRRWLARRGPLARGGLALAALAALVAAGYYATSTEPVEWVALYAGQPLAPETLDAVEATLDAADVPHRASGRRLSVPAARRAEALAALARAKVGPRTLKQLADEARAGASFLDGSAEREDRQGWALRRELETIIERYNGIASAEVLVARERTRPGFAAPVEVRALVFLQGTDDRPIPPETVRRIRHLLETRVPALRPDSITVQDRAHDYLVAGHPELGVRSEAQARVEALRGEILKHVEHIDGVRVSVALDGPPARENAPITPAADGPLRPNHPAEAEPIAPAAPNRPEALATPGRVKVLVEVPSRYYLDTFSALHPDRMPGRDEVAPWVARTTEEVQLAVRHVVPAAELAELRVVTIQSPPPARVTAAPPASPEPWRNRAAWAIGAAGAVLTIAGAAGGRWLATRRPPRRSPPPAAPRPHFEADATGPSERVRELVRRDPEAAAGVLNRWIGAGEEPQ